MFHKYSIKFKVFLGYLSLSALVVSLLSFLNYRSSTKVLEYQLGERLKHISSTSALMIDIQSHNNIVKSYLAGEKNIHQTSNFKKIQLKLKEIQKQYNLTSDIYTLIVPEWIEKKMIFITMTNDKPYIGNSLPLSNHVKRAYQSKKTIFTNLYEDTEGQWISSVTPLLDKNNHVVAVIQVDYDATRELKNVFNKMIQNFLVNMGIALSISFILSVVIEHLVIKPLRSITEEASQIFENNFEVTISGEDVKGTVGILAKSFNSVIGKVRDHTHNLESMIDERTSQIQALQNQLVNQAYTQGQAENAIGMLHNLGNLITPAMTRISLNDEVESLELTFKVIEGISHQLKKIEPSTQEKDTHIHSLLETLNELKIEVKRNTEFIQENKSFIKNTIEKMAEVISAQQKYADTSEKGTKILPLSQLIDEALVTHQSDISKKEIKIEKDFQANPQVEVEKNRFTNIIDNFLINAIESIEEKSTHDEKFIRITILENKKENKANLIFEDNGIGFDEKTALKIFNFGFSTKNRTTSFGLHNCANFIHSCQGTLEVTSPGPNQGAKVFVSIPISQEKISSAS